MSFDKEMLDLVDYVLDGRIGSARAVEAARPGPAPLARPGSVARRGRARRRAEGVPLSIDQFKANPARAFPAIGQNAILSVSLDQNAPEAMPVYQYSDRYAITYVI